MPDTTSVSWPLRRVDWIVLLVHGVLVLAVAGWLTATAMHLDRAPDQWMPLIVPIVVCGLGFLALTTAPLYPLIGLWVYIVLAYGFRHYQPEYGILLDTMTLEWVAMLTALGWLGWLIRHGQRPAMPGNRLTWLLLAFVLWVGISSAASLLVVYPWEPYMKYHPFRFGSAAVMFLVAARFLKGPREFCLLGLILGGSLAVRAALAPESVRLNGDLAALIVIAIPLVLLAAQLTQQMILRVVFVLLALDLSWLLYETRNRGAAVAAVAVVGLLWMQSRHKVLALALALPVIVAGSTMFMSTSYWQRFADLWENGPARGSAESRLEIWEGSWKMFREHPLTGVGPGNYVALLKDYAPRHQGFGPHNNYIALLSETGLPGLMLYVAFFLSAAGVLWHVGRSHVDVWPGGAARFALAALVAYLVAGCFIARQTQTLAYVLAGASVALCGVGNASITDRHQPAIQN